MMAMIPRGGGGGGKHISRPPAAHLGYSEARLMQDIVARQNRNITQLLQDLKIVYNFCQKISTTAEGCDHHVEAR